MEQIAEFCISAYYPLTLLACSLSLKRGLLDLKASDSERSLAGAHPST